MKSNEQNLPYFLETPGGYYTKRGYWYHLTPEFISKYFPSFKDEEHLEEILKKADSWIYSVDHLSLCLGLILLWTTEAWIALGVSLLFYISWMYLKSAFVSSLFNTVTKIFSTTGIIIFIGMISLTPLTYKGEFTTFYWGIALFFLYKTHVLSAIFQRYSNYFTYKGMGLNDRLLQMILIKESIAIDEVPHEIQAMEDSLKSMIRKKVTKR